jgi:hypothetical protein
MLNDTYKPILVPKILGIKVNKTQDLLIVNMEVNVDLQKKGYKMIDISRDVIF